MRSHLPLILAAAGALLTPACGGPAPEVSQPDILLVTVDSLRADRPGFMGGSVKTPAMDRVAEKGFVFTRAYSTAPQTLPSLASLHTGLYPPSHGARLDLHTRLDGSLATLASRLKGAGYLTAAFAGAQSLHPKYGLGKGFDSYEEAFQDLPRLSAAGSTSVPGKRMADRALEWLEGLEGGQRFFLWVNFHDTHYFHAPPPPFTEEYPDDPYGGEVALVDQEMGRILSWLTDHDRDGTTVVVLAGNHGEGLDDGEEQYHGILLGELTLRIPLVIRPPGGLEGPERVDRPVSLVDVAPTILHLAGAGAGPEMEGVILAGDPGTGETPPPPRPLYFETLLPRQLFGWAPLRGVRSGGLKYVEAPGTGWSALYDLEADPGEAADLSSERADDLHRLREETARMGGDLATEPEGLTGAVAELVDSLGLSTVPPDRDPELPPEMVDVGNAALQAHRSLQRRMFQAATLLVDDVLTKDPDNYVSLMDATALSMGMRDVPTAVNHLHTAQAAYPTDGEIYHQLGHITLMIDQGEEAISRAGRLFEAAARLAPLNEEALYDTACALSRRDPERALDYLEAAVKNGFRDFQHMARDTDMNPIRDTARFQQITGGLAVAPAGGKSPAPGAPASPPGPGAPAGDGSP
jgi:arylsulfatase A-like enzyme